MSRIEPFYFGPDRATFGIYHPAEANPRHHGVLIAGPLLNDIMRAHFALRAIAQRLAGSGFDVMRFDYAGMGNSMQATETVRVDDWQRNIRDAFKELKEISGATSVSVVAVRFSAYLASELGKTVDIDKAVFWDPILEGDWWLRKIRDAQTAAMNGAEFPVAGSDHEFLGMNMHPHFAEDLENSTHADLSGNNIRVVATDLDPYTGLHSASIEQIPFSCHWDEIYAEVLHPHPIIDAICKNFQ